MDHVMYEPDVTLTDYGLAVECAVFAFALLRTAGHQIALRLGGTGFFLFLGLSAAIGGTVHGFCSSEETTTCAVLWVMTLETVGLAAASLWVSGAMLLSEKIAPRLCVLAVPLLTIYSIAVLLVTQSFWIAFTAYLPAMLLLLLGLLTTRLSLSWKSRLIGVVGVLVSLSSCVVQFLKIGLHPVYLTHNALAHVIQGIAMALLFVALRHAVLAPRDS
jgi:hypothetical protein